MKIKATIEVEYTVNPEEYVRSIREMGAKGILDFEEQTFINELFGLLYSGNDSVDPNPEITVKVEEVQ